MSIIDFNSKKSVKDGVTPIQNVLDDVSRMSPNLDTVLVLARTSDGDFTMWGSGSDDPAEWALIMEVCRMRMINGMFG